MAWRDRPLDYDTATAEGATMGQDVHDAGMAWDHSHEYPGCLAVRLYVGCGVQGRHHPSPALGRSDVAQLWRWARRRDVALPLPLSIQDWWLTCTEAEREGLRAGLKLMRPVAWIAFWLTA